MNRLTYRDESLPRKSADGRTIEAYSDYDARDVINRLAEFEDTEWEPEQIRSWSTLIRIVLELSSEVDGSLKIDRLEEILKAELEGRLAILDDPKQTSLLQYCVEVESLMARWGFTTIPQMDNVFRRVNALGGTDKMSEYKQAEDEGRLVVLPCTIGDVVYDISDGFPYATRVLQFVVFQDGKIGCRTVSGFPDVEDFGARIFLTERAAEEALSKLNPYPYDVSSSEDSEDDAVHEKKIPTNSEVLRAMSDSNLAKFLARPTCNECPLYNYCYKHQPGSCYQAFYTWLQSSADQGASESSLCSM